MSNRNLTNDEEKALMVCSRKYGTGWQQTMIDFCQDGTWKREHNGKTLLGIYNRFGADWIKSYTL